MAKDTKLFTPFDIKKKVDLIIDEALSLSIKTTPQRNLIQTATVEISPVIFLDSILSSVDQSIRLAEDKINEISAQDLSDTEVKFFEAASSLQFSPSEPLKYSPVEYNTLVELAQNVAVTT